MATGHVQLLGTGQLLELQRKLRAAGNESLRASMQRRIRAAAEPLANDLRSSVRSLPVRGSGGGGRRPDPRAASRGGRVAGMRETVARAIRISVRTSGSPGARVWIDKSLLPHAMRNLPALMDSGRWRHPTFGHSPWSTSYAQPWWDVTVRRHEARMRAQMSRVINDVQNRLN